MAPVQLQLAPGTQKCHCPLLVGWHDYSSLWSDPSFYSASDELGPCGGRTRLLFLLPVFLLHENLTWDRHVCSIGHESKNIPMCLKTASCLTFISSERCVSLCVHVVQRVCLQLVVPVRWVAPAGCWKLVCFTFREEKRKAQKWLHGWLKTLFTWAINMKKTTQCSLKHNQQWGQIPR